MDIVVIDGTSYDVAVSEITEGFTILYSENTGRSLADGGRMILDPIGTFFTHSVTFERKSGGEEAFDELYNFLSIPRSVGFDLRVVHNQETIEYEAYVSNAERRLMRVDPNTGKVYWDSLKVNFIPMKAQVTPYGD